MKGILRKQKDELAYRDHRTAHQSSTPAPSSIQWMGPQCWVAEAWIDSEGRETTSEATGALGIFAVSVHEQFPTDVHQRLWLLEEVAQRLGKRVTANHDSLWVFPGGYFGFNSSARRPFHAEDWPGFDTNVVQTRLLDVLQKYPPHTRLAFGADKKSCEEQQVWVCSLDANGSLQIQTITGGKADLPDRKIQIGSIKAAFFICGEFTGSHTEANGPYFNNHYLANPADQLQDCRLLVDLAHSRIRGNIGGGQPGQRLVHRRQMLCFASRGASVLTHHHSGLQTDGRARNDCQSNWVVFRGREQLRESQVHLVFGNS